MAAKKIVDIFVLTSLLSCACLSQATLSPQGTELKMTASLPKVQLGDTLTLACSWISETEEYPIIWKYNLEIIHNVNFSIQTYSDVEGPSSTLTISNVQMSYQGLYSCEAHDGEFFDSYTLKLQLALYMYVTQMQPEQDGIYTADMGEQLAIMCLMEGRMTSQISWAFTGMDGIKLTSDQYIEMYSTIGVHTRSFVNKNGSYLEIKLLTISLLQSGVYACESDGQTNHLNLNVIGSTISCHPSMQTVQHASNARFSCDIQSNPQVLGSRDIKWEKYKSGQMRTGLTDQNNKYVMKCEAKADQVTSVATLTVMDADQNDDATSFTLSLIAQHDVMSTVSLTVLPIVDNGSPDKCRDMSCDKSRHCIEGRCICKPGTIPVGLECLAEPSSTEDEERDKKGKGNGADPSSKGNNDPYGGNGDRDKPVVIVSHSSVAVTVGSTLGSIAFIILLFVCYICYRRRKKKSKAAITKQAGNHLDPNYLYSYEYHSEANLIKDNPTFSNPGYQVPPPKPTLRKENTYVTTLDRENLEFPRERLQLGVDLGEGRFGKVIQARAMNITGTGNWERVAVKTCRGTATDSEKEDLYQELEIMRKLPNNINIVSLFGCCSKTDPLYIIMEYVQRGSMLDYLRKCRPSSRMSRDSTGSSMTTSYSSFMEPRAKDLTIFALQIARGMAHVASCGIIHRDLAARNILLATDFTCKICDFGLARDVEGVDVYERTSKGPLPIRWMAPESLSDNIFTRKSDAWSYGVLLWEIVTLGATPYPGKSAMEVMRQVLQGSYLQRPLHCKEEMYELMVKCWEKEEHRPMFSEIVTHHEALMDDDYIVLGDYDEDDYGWLENYTMDERV